MFCEKDVLENFANLTEKYLHWILFFNKETSTQVFFAEFCEIFRAYFFQNTSRQMLLHDKTNISRVQIFTYLNIQMLRIVIYFLCEFALQSDITYHINDNVYWCTKSCCYPLDFILILLKALVMLSSLE